MQVHPSGEGAGKEPRARTDAVLESPAELAIGEIPVARRRTTVGVLIELVLLASIGAAVGMSSIAGFGAVLRRLGHFQAIWIAALVGAVLIAFVGYRIAFEGVVWAGESTGLSHRQRVGVVLAGFGAFVHRGGTAIDRYIMRLTGHTKREADVRLAALQVLEMVPMALGACTAAYVALIVGGHGRPPIGYDVPWAVGPVLAAPVVLFAVHRYRHRLRGAGGWRYWLGVMLDGISMVQSELIRDRRRRIAFLGITMFAAGELLAVWSAMAAFGFQMSGAGLVLGYGIGYVMSRRSAPLGGAGVIDVMLIYALAKAGAPLPAAIVGTFTYRFFNLWCSIPASLAALGSVRRLVGGHDRRRTTAGG